MFQRKAGLYRVPELILMFTKINNWFAIFAVFLCIITINGI